MEPLIDEQDREAWSELLEQAAAHARTQGFKRRVELAKHLCDRALNEHPNAAIGSSFGKDSCAMTHLVCVELGHRLPVYCHRDDLDFPEAREFSERFTARWDLDTRFLTAPFSVRQWLNEHAHELESGADLHGRATAMAKGAFYDVIDAAMAQYDCVFIGMRADESRARRMNRAVRTDLYRKKHSRRHDGQWTCTPLGGWHGIDVYAYAVSRGLELMPLYQCIAFMHRTEPWRVRESWWIPEANTARYGGIAWLRRYYPSLWRQLRAWMPNDVIQRS